MLNKKQFKDALVYNDSSDQSFEDLPWQWDGHGVMGDLFVWVTIVYQLENGLKPDGKLGPKTASRIKSEMKVSVESTPVVKIPKGEFSNAIIINGKRVKLPQSMIDAGLTASNYLDDGGPHFKHKLRKSKPIHFVLHETVGNTAEGCKKTLLRKGYGVQLIFDPEGHLSCHGDLVLDYMIHANQLSKTSFGIEFVNPYSPLYARSGGPFSKFIPAQWWTWVPSVKMSGVKKLLAKKGWGKVPRQYVSITDKQMEAFYTLAPWICHVSGVPYRFPTKGLNKKKRHIDGWNIKPKARPGAGVVAHRDQSSHSDGRYILERLISARDE